MAAIIQAQSVLADAEKSLRELIQQELRAQRYAAVAELAGIADSLARLARGVSPRSVAGEQSGTPSPPATPVPTPPSTRATAKRKAAKRDYPRFERDEDKLVKVGWSKRAREEYEHRAPRAAVLAFAVHVGAATTPGRTFTIDELLPVHDAAGEELPSYQVYLGLAWLRQFGAVRKKGRDGYLRTADPLDGSSFDTMWDAVPQRS